MFHYHQYKCCIFYYINGNMPISKIRLIILKIQWDFNVNIITLIILIIFYISSTIILLISIAIYKINQKKMDKIIELYIEEGFYLPTGITIQRFGRMRDQFQVVMFFYRLLTGKKMKKIILIANICTKNLMILFKIYPPA